jgi:hypothetical protein
LSVSNFKLVAAYNRAVPSMPKIPPLRIFRVFEYFVEKTPITPLIGFGWQKVPNETEIIMDNIHSH